MSGEYYLVVFEQTEQAILAQKLLADLEAMVMPTLREISVSCGLSLRLKPEHLEEARRRLRGAALSDWQIYHISFADNRLRCQLLRE